MSSLDIVCILPFPIQKDGRFPIKYWKKKLNKIKTVDLKAEELFIRYSAESFQVTGESLDPSGIPR